MRKPLYKRSRPAARIVGERDNEMKAVVKAIKRSTSYLN